MIDTSKHTFIATAAFGLEGLVKRELLRLGFVSCTCFSANGFAIGERKQNT